MSDPSLNIVEEEINHLFLCFCTFVNNLKGKKLSIQNVFVATIQEEKLKSILKTILSIDSDQELVKVFLEYDPTIAKSKYVTRVFNNKKHLDKKPKKGGKRLPKTNL
jgi:hypothetical protein